MATSDTMHVSSDKNTVSKRSSSPLAEYREDLWSRVLGHRESLIQSLVLEDLLKIGDNIEKKVSSGSKRSEDEWRSYIKSVLESYFCRACNEALDPNDRTKSLNSLKALFATIDLILSDNSDKKKKSSSVVSLDNNDSSSRAKSKKADEEEEEEQPVEGAAEALEEVIVAKNKEIEIVSILDSSDEEEQASKPSYPSMSRNYTLLANLKLRADEHKGSPHSQFSSSVFERPAVHFALDKDTHVVPSVEVKDVIRRLSKWEPNWIIKENLAVLQTALPKKQNSQFTRLQTALAFSFTIPNSYASNASMKWRAPADKTNNTGKKVLLLRMIPKLVSDKYPDTTMWPKGTFLQLNAQPVHVNQRKQQTHDDKLWKSMCYALDLTPHINPKATNTIELCTYDNTLFYLHLAIVEYISPQDLMPTVQTTTSYDNSVQQAKYYVNRQTVKLDDDDDHENNIPLHQTNDAIPLTFSLSCPISMVKISTPTRGRNCEHIQCFDLLTFLSSNSFPYARRWRCVLCEKLTSVDELLKCQMFTNMLHKFGSSIEPGSKDKVELKDGCTDWTLLDQKLLKRGSPASDEQENMNQEHLNKRRKPVEEIILV